VEPELSSLGLEPAAARVVGEYLDVLGSHLPVGRRARIGIRAEIADGLACAIEGRMVRGEPARSAAVAAVADLGDPRELALAFAGQLGPVTAHRLGVALVGSGPLVGLIWVAARSDGGSDWPARVGTVLAAVPLYPPILAVTVPAAVVAIAGAGWFARRWPLPRRLVTAAAVVAAIGCAAGDLSLLTAAVVSQPVGRPAPALVVLAAAASVVRLSAVSWAGRRIVRLRAAGC